MFVCVLDDSGSNKEGPAFVLAGYLASVSAWDAFSGHWQAVLDKPPKLEYFKMREANSLRGQFWGWSPEARDQRVMEFVEVISDSQMIGGVTSSIFWDDFKHICAEFPDVPLHPYHILFHGAMAAVVAYCRRQAMKQPINFVFDEQGSWAAHALQAFETAFPMLMDEERELIGGPPTHRSDHKFLPLQAADLIAWQTRRFCEDNKDVDPLAPTNQFVMNSAALRKLDHVGTLCNTYGLDRLRAMATDLRVARRLLGDKPDLDALRRWSETPF